MGLIRATVTLDAAVAAKVRQMFGGNLSKGVNALLFEHLFKERGKSVFGLLKGEGLVAELEKIKREEDARYAKLYRGR